MLVRCLSGWLLNIWRLKSLFFAKYQLLCVAMSTAAGAPPPKELTFTIRGRGGLMIINAVQVVVDIALR
jgi:hypothetical protein